MNTSTLKTAALSLLIGFGALSAMPAAANASGIYFEFGNGPRAEHGFRPDGHRRHYRDHGWRRDFCSPRRAVHKARRMGLHRARVARVGHRRSVVRGHRHGYRARIVFARAPRCPVIAYR
jgi:hypothetical protein